MCVYVCVQWNVCGPVGWPCPGEWRVEGRVAGSVEEFGGGWKGVLNSPSSG